MFAEYLNAGGNWLESEIYIKATQLQTTQRKGREVLQLMIYMKHFQLDLLFRLYDLGLGLQVPIYSSVKASDHVSEVYIRYMDLVAQEGQEAAQTIRARKRELEAQNTSGLEDPYIMPHPELPGNEATVLIKTYKPYPSTNL